MFGPGWDDHLADAELFTSPVYKPAVASSFDWADGVMHSTMSMPEYDSPVNSFATTEFGMASLAFSELLSPFDAPLERPKGASLPIPMIQAPPKPRKKLFPFGPSVLRPFTSFEATELSVEQLRGAFQRNERKLNLERRKE